MTTLVIGANRGIGFEIAKQLSDRGDDVVATYRATPGELPSLGVDTIEGVDIATDVATLVDALEGKKLDAVYVVAGALKSTSLDDLDLDLVRELFEINAVGPLHVTAALNAAGNFNQGAKVGLLTSRMGSIADNTSGGQYAYRMSKAALNMAGKSLSKDLSSAGVLVTVLHPGFVRTEMTGGNGMIDADESARGLIDRVDQLTPELTGTFWHQNGEELPW